MEERENWGRGDASSGIGRIINLCPKCFINERTWLLAAERTNGRTDERNAAARWKNNESRYFGYRWQRVRCALASALCEFAINNTLICTRASPPPLSRLTITRNFLAIGDPPSPPLVRLSSRFPFFLSAQFASHSQFTLWRVPADDCFIVNNNLRGLPRRYCNFRASMFVQTRGRSRIHWVVATRGKERESGRESERERGERGRRDYGISGGIMKARTYKGAQNTRTWLRQFTLN